MTRKPPAPPAKPSPAWATPRPRWSRPSDQSRPAGLGGLASDGEADNLRFVSRGRFITFEGGEGTGKSTQSRILAERLRGLGREVVLTREPGGSEAAESLRPILLEGAGDRWSPTAETLLMYAGRADH